MSDYNDREIQILTTVHTRGGDLLAELEAHAEVGRIAPKGHEDDRDIVEHVRAMSQEERDELTAQIESSQENTDS